MATFKMALRNLLRHKRRALITASAISFAYALQLISFGLGDGVHMQMIEMAVRMGSGHVVVQGEGFQDDQTLDYIVPEPAKVFTAIEQSGLEADVAPRLMGNGLARAGAKSVGVGIIGVDPVAEAKVNDLAGDEKRSAGAWLRPRSAMEHQNQLSDLYVGTALAEALAVELGDRVALTVQPKDADEPRSMAFRVRGLFRTGNDEMDGFLVFIPLEEAQPLMGVGAAVSQIALLLPSEELTAQAAATLQTPLAGDPVEVLPWQKALPELNEFIALDDASAYLFMGIIYLLVGLGIFNTVLTSVIERTREFGLLRSLGVKPGGVLSLVLIEAVLLGIFAVGVGLGLGLWANHHFATEGIDYGAMVGGDSMELVGLNLAMVVYAHLSPERVVTSLIAVFSIVIVAALWPAVRAARMKPLEALHHV